MKKENNLISRVRSIGFAWHGLRFLVRTEPNARIHLLATALVIAAGLLRPPGRTGWLALIMSIALVWITEALNTAAEQLCDLYAGQSFHPVIRRIKDVAAAAVLLAAITAVLTACFVFL